MDDDLFFMAADASARMSRVFAIDARPLLPKSAMCLACLYQQQWQCSQKPRNPYGLNCRTLVGNK